MIRFVLLICSLFFSTVCSAADKPTVVLFTADWCKYCQQLKPVIGQLREARFEIVEANVDKSPNLVQFYNVKEIPTLLVILDGKEVGRTPSNPKLADILRLFGKHKIKPIAPAPAQ